MYRWDLLDFTVGDSAAVLKLLPHVDEAVLVGEISLPVGNREASEKSAVADHLSKRAHHSSEIFRQACGV